MITKETFKNGKDTLVGLPAEEVIEFIKNSEKFSIDYITDNAYPMDFNRYGRIVFDLPSGYERIGGTGRGHISIHFKYVQTNPKSYRFNVSNLFRVIMEVDKITESQVYLPENFEF